MKDKIIISLTDINGPRHFIFSGFFRRCSVYAAIFLCVVITSVFAWLVFQNHNLDALVQDKDRIIQDLQRKYADTLKADRSLFDRAATDRRRLSSISAKTGKIETGIRSASLRKL